VITGRGPGAPSVTPDMVFTLHPDARGEPGNPAVDLGAIRRSEAIINLLGARRLLRPHALGDPAIAALSVLAADVDSQEAGIAAVPAALARSRAVRAAAAAGVAMAGVAMVGAAAGPTEARPSPAGAWVRVAAVAATAAGAAGSRGFALAGMLARLGRLPAGARNADREPAGWGWRPPVTGRPVPPGARRPR
jgi:hypothetical protein